VTTLEGAVKNHHDELRSPSDHAMARYATGDDAAFAEVYDGVAPLLERYLMRRVRDRAIVEDLLQQTFLKIHCHRARFIPGAKVLPWACSIAVRLLIDRARHDRLSRALFTEDDEAELQAGGEADPEQHLVARELASQLATAIAALPVGQRTAWRHVKEEGQSIRDVARSEGTTENGIKLRIFTAYQRLRGSLGRDRGAGADGDGDQGEGGEGERNGTGRGKGGRGKDRDRP
jgi:RNA polymerase sigma-70 factor (ECF subfamily)